uniref:Putative conserved secreted protein n=1 Tax=Culex tarsalis TaxID=7177 RepID=A0A1Q3FZR8_CULTA
MAISTKFFNLVIWVVLICSTPMGDAIDIPGYCDLHTTTTSQYEEYFNIDSMGNNRSEKNIVDFVMYVQLQNMQEEIALLLSVSNHSRQHPDYEKTYEIRISNVYTVIYKETLRMSAHHSHTFNFFPAEHFQVHIRITRKGLITVQIDGLPKPILSVVDDQPPIDVHFVSFGSRMNAYPITWYMHCRDPPTTPLPPSDKPEEGEGHFSQNDAADLDENRCPVCPMPAKCEVVVRACADTSTDSQGEMTDAEKQKYFFYFNMYLSKNGKNGGKAVSSASSSTAVDFNDSNKLD